MLHGTKCQRNGNESGEMNVFTCGRLDTELINWHISFQKEIIIMKLYFMPWYKLPVPYQKQVRCAIFNVQNLSVLKMGPLNEFDFQTASYVNIYIHWAPDFCWFLLTHLRTFKFFDSSWRNSFGEYQCYWWHDSASFQVYTMTTWIWWYVSDVLM